MVAEPWLLRMGNQVSTNVKHALLLENSKKSGALRGKEFIGILSFEVANIMSMIIHLHKSLTDHEIVKLKNEILSSVGIRTLVSDDETKILQLALVEKLDDLNRVASVVSRLGRKCTIPALQGFEHVYGDITAGVIDVKELEFLVKDMEGMVRKMERYVSSTARLYSEMEVMNELEVATKKFRQNQHEETWKAYEQKLAWQKQDVRHLKDVSLWNQTHDKVVELLARTVCTVYARISAVTDDIIARRASISVSISRGESLQHVKQEPEQQSGQIGLERSSGDSIKPVLSKRNSGSHKRNTSYHPRNGLQKSQSGLFCSKDFNFVCGIGLMECLSLSSASKYIDDNNAGSDDRSSQVSGCSSVASGARKEQWNFSSAYSRLLSGITLSGDSRMPKGSTSNNARFGPKSRVMLYALPSTVGGSALALHYANVIIVIEKLLRFPHLVGDEARDDLYQMLPQSLRKNLKTTLRSYSKGLEIYDAPLAQEWKQRLEEILKWLAPLAHNMITWQSERNFEQHQVVKRTNVLLLQTLYFGDRERIEAVVCELLVGLNYICRHEQQQNALLDCASSFDFEDYMEWQLQLGASFQAG
nr:uncharacterized protein LOC104086885 [Ipomoea trifida]